MINQLWTLGLTVEESQGQLKIKGARGALTPQLRSALKENREEVLDFLRSVRPGVKAENFIEKVDGEGPFVTSYGQKRLWVLQQSDPEMTAYNEYGITVLDIGLDRDGFEKAFDTLMERHEILRTTLEANASGDPVQRVHSHPWEKGKMRHLDLEDEMSPEDLRLMVREESRRLFHLSEGPLIRPLLVKDGNKRFVLILTTHHIISDAWSMGIMVREMQALYEAYTAGKPDPLPTLPVQFKDFANWQNQLIEKGEMSAHRAYWEEKLSGELPSCMLPNDYPMAAVKTHAGANHEIRLEGERLSSLLKWSSGKKISTFSVLLACFKVIIWKFSGQNDILVGAAVAGREHESLKDLIGFFINTVMIRNRIDPEQSFQVFLSGVHKSVTGAVNHQSYPLECVLEDLNLSKYYLNNPVSSVFFNKVDFQRTRGKKTSEFVDYSLPRKFDIEFHIQEFKDVIEINCIYKSELYKPETIICFMEYFENLLDKVQEDSHSSIIQLSRQPLSESIRSKDINRQGKTEELFSEASIEQSIPQRFEQIADRFPEKPAIFDREKTITYQELNQKANRLGWQLRRYLGESRPCCIALLFGQNSDMITAILGVLKSGHVYVPLDPAFPEKRLSAILEDARPLLLLTDIANSDSARNIISGTGISLIVTEEPDADLPSSNPVVQIKPEDPAYILYTSGSTGKPKGVLQLQRNVLHFIRAYTNNLALNYDDRLSLLPYYTFDAAVMDIYGALLNGASLHLFDFKKEGVQTLRRWIKREKISVLHMVPTLYRHLVKTLDDGEVFSSVRLLVLGGEAVTGSDFQTYRSHFSRRCLFVNGLGPTESTVTLQFICNQNDHQEVKNVPVGFAVQNTRVHIQSEKGEELGIWEVGEIVYESEHLSPGYVNDPEATRDAFPLDQNFKPANIYRSGDLGKRLPDGSIEFIGRKDAQVKLRGIRVELVEIESALLKMDGVREAVVVEKVISKSQQLVGYFAAETALSSEVIKKHMLQLLPHFMVPSFYVQLNELPVNSNGKTDRRALPEPVVQKESYRKTSVFTSAEQKLLRIWHQLFGEEEPGIDDDFFALGGNSLKATQLIFHIHKEFGVQLDFQTVFLHSTIRDLGRHLQKAESHAYSDILPVGEKSYYDVSHTQKRMWVLNEMEDERQGYLLSGAYKITGEFHIQSLEKAIRQVIGRHEGLRTVFRQVDGEPKQVILPEADFMIVTEDWRGRAEKDVLYQKILEENEIPFDLRQGPLLKLKIFRTEDNEFVMLFVMHHIVSDGWSFGILIREAFTLYSGFRQGVQLVLPSLAIQYKDYVYWQNGRLMGENMRRLRNFWQGLYSDQVPVLDLPRDFPRPLKRTLECADRRLVIPRDLSDSVKEVARKHKTSLYNMLLTAFGIILYKQTDQDDMVIASPVSGRSHQHLEHLIGLFINVLPYRIKFTEKDTFLQVLNKVRSVVNSCLEHQEYPFDLLVKDLAVERSSNRSVFYDVGFTWRDPHELPDFTNLGFEIEPMNIGFRRSQTDLLLACADTPHGISMNMTYHIKLFKPATIDGILDDIKVLLEEFLSDEQLTVAAYCSEGVKDEIFGKSSIFPELDL